MEKNGTIGLKSKPELVGCSYEDFMDKQAEIIEADTSIKFDEIENQKIVVDGRIYRGDVLAVRYASPENLKKLGVRRKGIAFEGDVLNLRLKGGCRKNLTVVGWTIDKNLPKKWFDVGSFKFTENYEKFLYLLDHGLPKEVVDDLDKFKEYREQFTTDTSVRVYISGLKKFYEIVGKYPEKITVDDIKKYIEKYGRGVQKKTVAHRIIILRAYFKWKGRRDLVEFLDEEAKHYKRLEKNEPVFFSKDDVKKIFESAGIVEKKSRENILRAKRNRAIVSLLYHTGIRGAELVNLKKHDIREKEKGYILLVRMGKGKKSRRVPLFFEAKECIDEYLKMRKDNEEWLFLSRNGKKLSVGSLEWIIHNIYEKAGIDKKYPEERLGTHSLRRAFATHLYQDGYDIYDLSKLLGHSSITTTQRYIGADEERAFENFAKIKKGVLE